MKEFGGYYDGKTVRLLEPVSTTKHKEIVTFTEEDEFNDLPIGILSDYADPQKRILEEGAFERAMVEK
jgi:hypothetical protein